MSALVRFVLSKRSLVYWYIDRIQRLKDARAEAQKEIEEYKQMKEQEFNAFQASVGFCILCGRSPVSLTCLVEHAGTTSTTQAALDRETDVKLAEIDDVYLKKKDAVVNTLLSRAILVKPELHRNLKSSA